MAVLIKSMEMPKRCWDCAFFDDDGDYPYCIANQKSSGYNFPPRVKRMSTCPLEDGTEYLSLYLRTIDD